MPNSALIIFEESQNFSVNLPTVATTRKLLVSLIVLSFFTSSLIDFSIFIKTFLNPLVEEETVNLFGEGGFPEPKGLSERQLDKPEPIGAKLRGAL
jgi:hypothetical protein